MCPQMVGRLSVTLFATKGSVGYLWQVTHARTDCATDSDWTLWTGPQKVTHARPTDETGSLVQVSVEQ